MRNYLVILIFVVLSYSCKSSVVLYYDYNSKEDVPLLKFDSPEHRNDYIKHVNDLIVIFINTNKKDHIKIYHEDFIIQDGIINCDEDMFEKLNVCKIFKIDVSYADLNMSINGLESEKIIKMKKGDSSFKYMIVQFDDRAKKYNIEFSNERKYSITKRKRGNEKWSSMLN